MLDHRKVSPCKARLEAGAKMSESKHITIEFVGVQLAIVAVQKRESV